MNVTVTTINRLTRAYFPRLSHILLLAAIALTCLQAQDITKGSVAGVVKDSSGAVIPAANVKLSTPTGDRTTTTNAGGDYSFLNLNPGPGYKVTAEKTGFAPASVDNLSIGINQQVTQDLTPTRPTPWPALVPPAPSHQADSLIADEHIRTAPPDAAPAPCPMHR